MSEAKCKAKNGEGLKILFPEEMLQRWPIALPQVKAGNNSENLLIKWNQTNRLFFVSIKKYVTYVT